MILSLLVAQPALVADQGLGPAGGHAAVPQPPGADQGQEGPGQGQGQAGEEAAARPEPPHPPRTGRGADRAGSRTLFPRRKIVVSGDSAYGGKSVLRHLPENVDLISRVASNAALYEPAPPRPPKQKGPPRKKGDRLPGMAEWAADETTPWEELEFDQYGLHAKLQGQDDPGVVLQGGQGPAADDRPGPRHRAGAGPTRCSTARGRTGTRGRSCRITRRAGAWR